jgi:hypothetical protein
MFVLSGQLLLAARQVAFCANDRHNLPSTIYLVQHGYADLQGAVGPAVDNAYPFPTESLTPAA